MMAIMGLSLLSVSYPSVLSQGSSHKIYPIIVSCANPFLRSPSRDCQAQALLCATERAKRENVWFAPGCSIPLVARH